MFGVRVVVCNDKSLPIRAPYSNPALTLTTTVTPTLIVILTPTIIRPSDLRYITELIYSYCIIFIGNDFKYFNEISHSSARGNVIWVLYSAPTMLAAFSSKRTLTHTKQTLRQTAALPASQR